MKPDKPLQLLTFLLRAGLAGLLVIAGALKLRAPAAFATEIANYQLLPAIAPFLAATLPTIEILLGVGLLVFKGPWRRAAAGGTLAVLVTFAAAVASAHLRHLNIDCGCFGTGGSPITVFTLVRNALLVGAAVALLVLDRTNQPRDHEVGHDFTSGVSTPKKRGIPSPGESDP